jgi:hypothetical protein
MTFPGKISRRIFNLTSSKGWFRTRRAHWPLGMDGIAPQHWHEPNPERRVPAEVVLRDIAGFHAIPAGRSHSETPSVSIFDAARLHETRVRFRPDAHDVSS